MSMIYWMIEGVGIKTDAIWNRLDDKKVVQFLAQEFPDEVTSMEAEAALVRLPVASPAPSTSVIICMVSRWIVWGKPLHSAMIPKS